MYMKEHILS